MLLSRRTSKLTVDQAEDLRQAHAQGATVRSLSERYGIRVESVRDIVRCSVHARAVLVELKAHEWAHFRSLATSDGTAAAARAAIEAWLESEVPK